MVGDFSAGKPPQLVFDVLGKLPDIEIDRGVGIDGVEMQVMEARRCEHRATLVSRTSCITQCMQRRIRDPSAFGSQETGVPGQQRIINMLR